MPRREILDRIQKYVHPFRITEGEGFRLKNYDPGNTCGLTLSKGEASELVQRGTEWLAQEQDMLYAQDRWSLLVVFQAMDAAGKDSTIKHVMSGVNPQGWCSRSSSPHKRTSTTTSCGGISGVCPSEGGSGSSIAPITRRS
jgi:polyphosphate kinase 2 (PPK2 family)